MSTLITTAVFINFFQFSIIFCLYDLVKQSNLYFSTKKVHSFCYLYQRLSINNLLEAVPENFLSASTLQLQDRGEFL